MADTPRVSVIIVNYNGGRFLQAAVDSLVAQTLAPEEILIVDNASSDGSIEALDLSSAPHARIMRQDDNLGFARGNNVAAAEAKGDWLAMLNPDAVADPDWLEVLARAIDEFPGTAMFASAQFDATDPGLLDGAGDAYFFLGIPWRGGFQRPVGELPGRGECFSPCGASALFRKDVFLGAGGFDERFFCYCEDVDIAFRLRLAGERCVFIPEARVRHEGSGISGRHSDFTIRHGTRNRLWTYVKNMPPVGLAITAPGHVAACLYLYVRAIGKSHAKAMRQGFVEGLTGIGPIWATRRRDRHMRRLSSLSVMRSMCFAPGRLSSRRPHVLPLPKASHGAGSARTWPE